jgi:hypothetical protein
MLSPCEVEELNDSIQRMDRDELTHHLRHFRARFPLDFTPDFYLNEPLPRLRHILFGLCLYSQKRIGVANAPTAMAA